MASVQPRSESKPCAERAAQVLSAAHAAYVLRGCAPATAAAVRSLLAGGASVVTRRAVEQLQRLTSLLHRALERSLVPPGAEETAELRALRRPLQRTHDYFQLLLLPVRPCSPVCAALTHTEGLESRHLESRAKASARLDLEVPARWVSPSSRGLWGGDALLLTPVLLET
jgi:hypothetical protein